jgi:MFS family permease
LVKLGFLSRRFWFSGRALFSVIIINAATLSWYMHFANSVGAKIVFQNITDNPSLFTIGEASFFLTAGISALIGVLLSKRINNKRFLWAWTFFGIMGTFLTLFFKGDFFIFIFGPILGIGMGLGFPFSFSLLASHIELERRGRAAGIMIFLTFAIAVFAGFLSYVFSFGATETVMTLVAIKCISFLGLAIIDISPSGQSVNQIVTASRIGIWEKNKTFLMYLIPWIIFIIATVLIDHVVWASLEQDPEIYSALHGPPYVYVATTVCALAAGFLADWGGRKIPIFIGLAVLGFSSALLGSVLSPETAFVHHISIGVAFGFLMTAYSTVPGDLSDKFNAEKLYALTIVIPIIIYFSLGSIPEYFGASATAISISWILTSLIFCSIVPVFLAKESLKEEKIAERRIKDHLKRIERLVKENKE